jgi:putative transposase
MGRRNIFWLPQMSVEACLWHHRFASRDEAFLVIAAWLEKYHTARPHSALGYLTPREFAEQLAA